MGQATWAVPDLPAARSLLDRLSDLVEAGAGSLLVLTATGYADRDIARLEQLYVEAREAEWAEFLTDCGRIRRCCDAGRCRHGRPATATIGGARPGGGLGGADRQREGITGQHRGILRW